MATLLISQTVTHTYMLDGEDFLDEQVKPEDGLPASLACDDGRGGDGPDAP